MRSITKKAALLAAAFLVCAAGPAGASPIEVKVPFPFLVQGKTLPAGQYRVERNGADPSVVLIRGEKGNNASMFVETRPVAGHDPAGEKPALTFTRREAQDRLTDIWVSNGQGLEIAGK